ALGEGLLDRLDQGLGDAAALAGEATLHERGAEDLAEAAEVGVVGAPLPALGEAPLAGEGGAQAEVLGDDRRAQVLGGRVDQVPAEVRPQGRRALAIEGAGEALEELGDADV